jgi:actin-related protein
MCEVGVVSDDNPQTVFPSLIGDLKDFITF